MFKKLMASLGQGGAKVDLVLHNDHFALGQEVTGKINVYGGTVEQLIDKIEVKLELEIQDHDYYIHQTVSKIPLSTTFDIHQQEQKSFPFQFRLPTNLPISGYSVLYHFETELDIVSGRDYKDRDPITILPPLELQNILTALQNLGFHETHGSRAFNGHVQEFELYPTSYFADSIEEIEFCVTILPDGLNLHLEVDVLSFFRHKKELKKRVFLDNHLLHDTYELEKYFKELLEEATHYYDSHSSQDSYPQHHYHENEHHKHHNRNMGAAVGGFAAGSIGGYILSEMLDDEDDDGREDFFEDEED